MKLACVCPALHLQFGLLTQPLPLPLPRCLQYAELRSRLEQVQSPELLVGLMDRMRSEMQRQGIRWATARQAASWPQSDTTCGVY